MSQIQIAGEWPHSQSTVTSALLNNIVQTFSDLTYRETMPKLLVINEPNRDCPMVNFEKIGEQTVVFLCTSSGNLWSQIAYQLSHELCHIHANFAEQQGHTFKWLEESICELASLCNMNMMGQEWLTDAPLPYMSSYAESLSEYVQNRINQISMPVQFNEWLEDNIKELKSNQYLRENNNVIAYKLMPIFNEDNKAWRAVGFMNKWAVNYDDSLSDYFSAWELNCPDDLKETVKAIARELGVNVA
jgi:hypothetical protein